MTNVLNKPPRHPWFAWLSLLLLSFPGPAEGGEDGDRILLSGEILMKGKILAVSEKGIDVFLDEGLRFFSWDALDPGLSVGLRAGRLALGCLPPVRARFELAMDCRCRGFLEYGRRQLARLREERPGLRTVVEIWLRDFPVKETDADLASGMDAFFQRQDLRAYVKLQKAAEGAPETLVADLAKKYLRILLRSGFQVPANEREPALSRTLILRRRNLQEKVFYAEEQVKIAEGQSRGLSVTKMRNALKRAEEALKKAQVSCAQILETGLEDRAKEVFEDLSRRLRNQLLEVHLKAGDFYLKRRTWTDAERSIGKALKIDPENLRAKALKERLRKARRTGHR